MLPTTGQHSMPSHHATPLNLSHINTLLPSPLPFLFPVFDLSLSNRQISILHGRRIIPFPSIHTHMPKYTTRPFVRVDIIYIYIYMYMRARVCVCVCV